MARIRNSNIVRIDKNVQRRRTRGEMLGGLLFLCIVVVANIYVVYQLYQSMTDVGAIPVRQVQVEGRLNVLTPQDIEEYFLRNPENQNLLTMDLFKVGDYMKTMPWIDKVVLRKKHPDILIISVVEYQPIAYYNDGILTSNWHVIHPDLTSFKQPLVHLYGPSGENEQRFARLALERYKVCQEYLDRVQLRIATMRYTEHFMWEIELTNNVVLYLGRETDAIGQNMRQSEVLTSRLQCFVRAYPQIENKELLEYADLRYDLGLAIKLKEMEPNDDERK